MDISVKAIITAIYNAIAGLSSDGVYVDSVNGLAGGAGTPADPTDTLAHAITIAAAKKLTRYYLAQGSYTMPAGAVSQMAIYGIWGGGTNHAMTNVAMNGCVIGQGVYFENCNISGSWTNTATYIGRFFHCAFLSGVCDVVDAYYCLIDAITISSTGWLYQCYGEHAVLAGGASTSIINIVGFAGLLDINSMTTGPTIYMWSSDGCRVYIEAACTSMNFIFYGDIAYTNGGGAGVVIKPNPRAGNVIIKTKTIDLNQAASDYTLFTGTDEVLDIEKLVIRTPNAVAGGALTSISIQTDDATPQTFISAVQGAVANLTAENQLTWTGICRLNVGKLVRLTIAGGATGVAYVCNVDVHYKAVSSGGYLA